MYLQEDIREINTIRNLVNTSLKCDREFKIPWNSSFVQRNQDMAKRQLLSLVLKETRPSVQVTNFHKAYTWAMVPTSDLIINNNNNSSHEESLPPIFSLHNSIRLTVYDPSTYCVPTKVILLRRKMVELQQMASDSLVPMDNLFCDLCNARCRTPAELLAHITSRQHTISHQELMSDSSYI